jgi:SAM-dependent methyltransferase
MSVMGISYSDALMYWKAKERGIQFDRLLTLGHQALALHPSEVAFFRGLYRRAFNSTSATPLDDYRWRDYADQFLRDFLGASSITVLDASPYEGADTIHDMNTPVPHMWHAQYDAVIDSGSLEHIFNFPVAMGNLVNMLKEGGTIFVSTPANNLMGHGFYQFSPELMFRVFSDANGFAIHKILLVEAGYPSVELTKNHIVYEVADPEDVRSRVGLISKKPVTMMIEAKKISAAPMFATIPLQSDYVAMWDNNKSSRMSSIKHVMLQSARKLPLSVRAPIRGRLDKRSFSLRNDTFYTRHRWR